MANAELLSQERQAAIAELVDSQGSLTVAAITETFGVSEATARRDLATLAAQNLILRVHGGAIKNNPVITRESPIEQRRQINAEIKQRIALATTQLIHDGETLFIAGGSTGIAVAQELHTHYELTIVTDSLLVANELRLQRKHTVVMLGGTLDLDEQAVRGTLSRIILKQIQVDKAIVGVKAISVERGLSAETAEEAEFIRSVMDAGNHIIVVTDSSKFAQTALMQVAPIDVVHTLVTDNLLDDDVVEKIREHGVYVITV